MAGDWSSGLPACSDACSVGWTRNGLLYPEASCLRPAFPNLQSASSWQTYWFTRSNKPF